MERAQEWQRAGLYPIVGDLLDPPTLASLPDADLLLCAVGYDRTSQASKHDVHVTGLSHLLQAVGQRVGRFLSISSSSVYGESGGEWVDESTPPRPLTEGGQICLEAENRLRDAAEQRLIREWSLLRLSGIYGPGRLLAKIDALRAGKVLPGRPDAWLNLIHVDDAVQAVIQAAEAVSPCPCCLVTDDRPVLRQEYYQTLAELIGAPEPRFDPSITPRHGRGRNKRCRNDRLRSQLNVSLKFPTYQEGLPHALGQENR